MQTEIQNLIDHPETLREVLKLKQLDGLIRKVTRCKSIIYTKMQKKPLFFNPIASNG